ncbi:MAG: peptidylprolyl isomerase [Paracoccaceae bacterium]|nr:peptidylprolyl isomerase [Paracoccaceae bacterium]
MRILTLVFSLLFFNTSVYANDILVIEIDGQVSGLVEVELLSEVAPKHVERVKALANIGAYNDVVFHRVIDGFMAQTGDIQFGKKGSSDIGKAGRGGSELPDLSEEFSNLEYSKGVVGMARSAHPDSANSQFFIMFDDAPFLNGKYTIFGKVISGQNIVDKIKRGEGSNGAVNDPDFMSKVYIKDDD